MEKIPLSEEQPRYIIDEGVSSEKEIKILSQEQERVLNKLLKATGHVLNEEEHELMVQLQEKLKRETERVQNLKKLKITDKPLDEYLSSYQKKKDGKSKATSDESLDDDDLKPSDQPKVTHVIGFKPEEVVRRYIDCWNQQKFGAEFDCFSRDFLTIKRDDYINARHLSYQQQLSGGGMKIDFQEIISIDSTAGDAEVIATKTTQLGNRKPQEETERYRLKLEKGRWVIYAVEPYS